MVSDIELEGLRRSLVSPPNTSVMSKFTHRRTRRAHTYHRTQNLHISRLIRVAEDPTSTRLLDDRADTSAFHIRAAIYLSIYGTIVVAGLQWQRVAARLKSTKLSDSTRWPVGAGRLCNAGNICFAFALMAVSMVLVVESIRALASSAHELGKFEVAAIVAAACGFGIKLFLAIYCFIFRRYSSQLQMLWEDNRNDCFEYGFAIFTSAAGAKLKWWVDPASAMLIASVIIVTWIGTIRSEFLELCGLGASPSLVQEIVFLTLRHSDLILKVDTVRAYHWGEDLFVEVDIVMAPECSLREAHDVSQELQDKLETVEGFGRAFVHVDYETSHIPEHRKTR
uniref:HhpE n=1 Tax=Byssochlamys spectabilis TaxID=264951 RepID=A0A7M4CBU0_BYSSP|nr:HhpE [Paecilomyces variotii]